MDSWGILVWAPLSVTMNIPFQPNLKFFCLMNLIYFFDKSPSLNHFLWWAFDGSSSGFFVWRKPSRRTSRAAPCWRRRPELRRRPDCLWRSIWPSFRPRNWRRRRAPLGAWRPGKRHQIPPPHPPHLPAAGCMKVPPHTPVAKISLGSIMKSGTLPTGRFDIAPVSGQRRYLLLSFWPDRQKRRAVQLVTHVWNCLRASVRLLRGIQQDWGCSADLLPTFLVELVCWGRKSFKGPVWYLAWFVLCILVKP